MRSLILWTMATGLLTAAWVASAEQGRWVIRGDQTNSQSPALIETANVVGPPGHFSHSGLETIALDNFAFSLSYFMSDRVSMELLAARPIEQRISVSGLGNVGAMIQLPPTVTLRYHFAPNQTWQPYVGAGVNWVSDFDGDALGGSKELRSEGTSGYALQAGVYYELSDRWMLNLETRYSNLDLALRDRSASSSVNASSQSNLSPMVTAFKLGYRF